MNFYYNEFSGRGQVGTPSTHLAVFEILNLNAALFIQGVEVAEVHNLEKLDNKMRLLIEAVQKLLVQVRSTALLLLDMLRVSTSPLVCTLSLHAPTLIAKYIGFSQIGIGYFIKHFPPSNSHQIFLI